MTVSFDIDFHKSIKGARDLQTSVASAGKTLDSMGDGAEKAAKAVARNTDKSIKVYDKLIKTLERTGKAGEEALTVLASLKYGAEGTFNKIAFSNQQASIVAEGYSKRLSDVGKMLRGTDAFNVYIAHQRKMNTELQKAELSAESYGKSTERLTSKQVKSAQSAKHAYTAQEYLATAYLRTGTNLAKATSDLQQANSADGKKLAHTKALTSGINQLNSAEARQEIQEKSLAKAIELGNNETSKSIERLKTQNARLLSAAKIKQEDAQYTLRQAEAVAKLERQLKGLNSEDGRRLAFLKQKYAEESRAQTKQNSTFRVGNQLAAAMRASMAGLQTSIGMYTSSTILAASAAYGLSRAIRSTITTGAEFQATMMRTQAIMSNSVSASFSDAVFKNMEEQVRALGRSTQFTASEVAAAMTELGQAGLSAGEAMIALEPTLNLSIIGQLDMAKAADHVTNIMMIFGKEAKDLTDIVDVMATAVTNSNTNVDQLANALTYAGPAAETMGISFKDTVAAVEALANSGFKASRSGTALRRLFVSLANPTKKGREVLDKFNISVLDLNGNTRSLTDLVDQLSRAFSDLGDTEKLAAIQNLVGVYAASPIAALIKQNETFQQLRHQLEYTGSAAEKMRDKIEQALKFDFKSTLSAFQEAQLQVFDSMEARLQLYTVRATEWLLDLSKPFGDDANISRLDVFIERAVGLSKAITGVGVAFIASSLTGPSGFVTGLGTSAKTSSTALFDFASKMRQAEASSKVLSLGLSNSNTAAKAAGVSYQLAARSLAALATGMAHVTTAAGLMATALSRILGALSWVGILYAGYEVFKSFFGDRSIQAVKDKQAEVSALALEYADVRDRIKEAANEQGRLAAGKQLETFKLAKEENLDEQKGLERSIERAKALGLETKKSEAELASLQRLAVNMDKTIQELSKKSRTPVLQSNLSIRAAIDSDITAVEVAKRSYEAALKSQAEFERRMAKGQKPLPYENAISEENAVKRAKERYLKAVEYANKEQQGKTAAQKGYDTAIEKSDAKREEIRIKAKEQADFDRLNEADQHIVLLDRRTKAEAEANAARAKFSKDKIRENEEEMTAKEDQYNRLNAQVIESEGKQKDYLKLTELAAKKRDELNLTEVQRLALVNTELDKNKALQDKVAATLSRDNLTDSERLKAQREALKLLEKEIDLTGQKQALTKKADREIGKTARQLKGEARELEKAQKVFDKIREKYDAVAVSSSKMEDTFEKLQLLQSKGKISAYEYAEAAAEIAKQHYAVEKAQDKVISKVERLREAYSVSAYQKEIDDLSDLEFAYKRGGMALKEYEKIKSEILKKNEVKHEDRVRFEAPAASGLFSESVNIMTSTASQMGKFDTESADAGDEFEKSMIRAQEQYDKQMEMLEKQKMRENGMEQEYAKRSKEIHDKANSDRLAATQIFGKKNTQIIEDAAAYEIQARKMLMASMAGGLSDMMGMLADAAEEGSAAQKVAFVAQKALAVAQIILQTQIAVGNANATSPTGISPLAPWIAAQGYASAGLVAALSIGELSSKSKSKDSSYAGAYDKGGYIPTGKYGIVGEYGPEIVNGPANVTGREATARKLGGGGDTYNIAPEINIEYKSEGSSSPEQSRQDATMLGNTVKLVVLDTLKNEMRPNGMLYRR